MNLEKIKKIIDIPLISDADKETLIINEISKNKNVIPALINILHAEREHKSELINSMNLMLSKVDVILKQPKLNKDGFIQKEISEFYEKSGMNHCFKNTIKTQ